MARCDGDVIDDDVPESEPNKGGNVPDSVADSPPAKRQRKRKLARNRGSRYTRGLCAAQQD